MKNSFNSPTIQDKSNKRKIESIVFYSRCYGEAISSLRVLGPAQVAGVNIIRGLIEPMPVDINAVKDADLVIIQRDFCYYYDAYEKIVSLAHSLNKPVVLDLDDLLFDLPEEHPDRLSNYFTDTLLPLLQTVMEADLITVATIPLREVLLPYNQNIKVIPNYLDDSLWHLNKSPDIRNNNEEIIIGYMGGHTHKPDLYMVLPALLEVVKKYPNRVRFHFWGIEPPNELLPYSTMENCPQEYSVFADFFQKQSADIVIAPLCENTFNRCKSPIKFFEYTAAGMPGVYSHVAPYYEIIENEKEGLLASTTEEWVSALSKLIDAPELRKELVQNAKEKICDHWLLSNNINNRILIYEELISKKGKKEINYPFFFDFIKSFSRQYFEKKQKEFSFQSLNKLIDEINIQMVIKNQNIQSLNALVAERDQTIQTLTAQVSDLDQKNNSSLSQDNLAQNDITTLKEYLNQHDLVIQELNSKLSEIYGSTAWKLIQKMWKVRLWMAPNGSLREKIGRFIFNLRHKISITNPIPQQKNIKSEIAVKPELNQQRWGIMATPHTIFIANLIADRLHKYNCQVDIMVSAPTVFSHDYYVVICPQMFTRLPSGEKRIVFQMEQSVSSRWFTEEYFKILNESWVVLEYNLYNIEFLDSHGIVYPHIYYLPVGATTNYFDNHPPKEKDIEVLFLGDSYSSPRRQRMLEALSQKFNVKIINDLFGLDLINYIKRSKVVINIHYYENALLETPRIQECLSLGVPIVSESSQDKDDYPQFAEVVNYFEENSILSMIEVVNKTLQNLPSSSSIIKSVEVSSENFDFMFDRFLVGMGFLPFSHTQKMSFPTFGPRLVLTLPETIKRYRSFQSIIPNNTISITGIRYKPGWVGCGLSYATIARKALNLKITRLTVMEDDVLLPEDFEEKNKIVNDYLDSVEGDWDIFAGFIASLHSDVKILKVEFFKGIRFVTVDRMTSMVFNIYSEKALNILASWDPGNSDVQKNTIDRYIENKSNLRIVVVVPFLVGHKEDVNSTVWGFQNTQYLDMVNTSQRELFLKIWAYEKNKPRSF